MRLAREGAGLIARFRQRFWAKRLKVLAKNFLRHISFGRILAHGLSGREHSVRSSGCRPRATAAYAGATSETATPATAFTGPARHHGGPPVRPSSIGLATFRPDQGRARTTPSGEAEPGASWFGVRTTLGHHIPLSCVRAAETTLVSGFIPSRGPLRFWIPPGREPCPAGARPHFRCSFLLPCLQRLSNQAYQWGHPVARPATVSSLNAIRMTEISSSPIGRACGNC